MKFPIKVLQVFTILDRGGAEANLMSYYRHIDLTKVHFDFLVHRDKKGAFEDEIIQKGGNIFRLPHIHPKSLTHYKKAVKEFFEQHGHQYSVIHGQLSELGIYIYKEAKKHNIPVIIAHAHNSKMPLDAKAPFRWWWKKEMMKYINSYFSCGEEASVWFFGKEKAKEAIVMNNSIEASKFRYDSKLDTQFRKSLNAEESLNFIHVGNFTYQKNHEFLVEVFNEILKLKPNAKLFLIGRDTDTSIKSKVISKAEQWKIQDKVIFLGEKSNVNEILQAMDCFIFPSLFEGFGIAFLEAQASGIPCIISERVPEEANIIPEITHRISLKQNAAHWAKEILEILPQYKRIQNATEVIVAKGYDAANNARLLTEKYIELIEANS